MKELALSNRPAPGATSGSILKRPGATAADKDIDGRFGSESCRGRGYLADDATNRRITEQNSKAGI